MSSPDDRHVNQGRGTAAVHQSRPARCKEQRDLRLCCDGQGILGRIGDLGRHGVRVACRGWVGPESLVIAEVPGAVDQVVKVAGRLASVRASLRDNDTIRLARYRREHLPFRDAAYRAGLCEPLWLQLERLAG